MQEPDIEYELKEVKKTDRRAVEFKQETLGLGSKVTSTFKTQERDMLHQDNLILELLMSKNMLEAYVYDMRAHIDDQGDFKDYIQQDARVAFLTRLKDVEVWIYGEGKDSAREKYLETLKELRAVGDPVRARFQFHQAMPVLIQQYMDALQAAGQRATDIDPAQSHITAEEKAKVLELVASGNEYVQGVVKGQEGR